MQPSIPWSSSISLFVVEMMAILYSLKCTVPFSFAVPPFSLAVTHRHSLSLVVIRCHSLYNSLSLDVPPVCLFINDAKYVFVAVFEKQLLRNISKIKLSPEAAILMRFSISLLRTYSEIIRKISLTECNF